MSVLSRMLLWALALCMLLTPAAGLATDSSPLLWDDSPGYQPDPSCYTQDGYHDQSILVEIRNTRHADSEFYAAYVTIKHASQLRTGLATITGSKYHKTTRMAKVYQAVVAINGDYFLDRSKGLTIRQGVTLRDKPSDDYDVLLIDTNGDFHIVRRDNLDMLDFYLYGGLTIQNAFSFGPALVIDGKRQTIPEEYSFAPHYKNPRAAIGQMGPLQYVLVVVDGRQSDSAGVSLETLAEFMESIGCEQAYNLDGGNSATLVLGEGIVNNKSLKNERSISDIIYFASYIDPINWGASVLPAASGGE